MKNYFYIDKNGQQSGPVSEDLLKQHGVTASTSVWCEGMSEWKKANEITELKYLFTTPPSYNEISQTPPPVNSNDEQCPDNYLVWAILSTILCCWPLGIPAIVNATKVEKLWNEGNKEEAKQKSEKTKIWCFIALGGGVLSAIIGGLLGLLGFFGTLASF